MYGLHYPFEAGYMLVSGNGKLPLLDLPYWVHHATGAGDDQPGTATRLLLMIGQYPLTPVTKRFGQVRTHRGNHHTVADIQLANAPRR